MPSRGAKDPATVDDGAARSVATPNAGFADVDTSTTDDVDLSEYAGQYVRVQVWGADTYVSFQAATGGSIDATAKALDSDGKFQGDGIPEIIKDGDFRDYVVSRKRPFLTYLSVDASASAIRVWRS